MPKGLSDMNDKSAKIDIILASASPRRREILTSLGVNFRIVTSDADESCNESDPGIRVERIAAAKCQAVIDLLNQNVEMLDNSLIIAADTLVLANGCFLGKPQDREDASRMLSMLSGKTHSVISGIAVFFHGRTVTSHEMTHVTFAPMSSMDIESYITTGEPFGKAGAYAIQGHASRYIRGIEGDYFNVVGLPVHRLFDTVRGEFGIDL